MLALSGIPGLLESAANSRKRKGIKFLRSGSVYSHLSYESLLSDAVSFAGYMKKSCPVGKLERVAIALPSSPEFVIAFFGTLLAGAVPVPLPHLDRFTAAGRYGDRMKAAITQSNIRYVMTTDYASKKLEKNFSFLSELNVSLISVDKTQIGFPESDYSDIGGELDLDSPALIQYTSGSTSKPKGIILTHRQVAANLEAINVGLNLCSEDVCCSWLPLFHDMGLIGCLLGSINSNIDLLLMEPIEFVRNPLNWLKPIDEFNATIASAPNSAYLRCIQRVTSDDLQSLNLSSWRVAMNGSEFVDPETMHTFSQHFQAANFKSRAFLPVYGMAEASLAVTFPPLDRDYAVICLDRKLLSRNEIEILPTDESEADTSSYMQVASVGTAATGIKVCILSEGSCLNQSEEQLGEICIRGCSVTDGYDSDVMNISESLIDGWLKTGDLGFFYRGELYIVGRVKDVIVLNGENFYAHDIELVVQQATELSSQNVMAFGLRRNGLEELILLVATSNALTCNDERQNIEDAIRTLLFSNFGITPSEIVFLTRDKLPMTSSGKLQRHKGSDLYIKYRCDSLLESDFATVAK